MLGGSLTAVLAALALVAWLLLGPDTYTAPPPRSADAAAADPSAAAATLRGLEDAVAAPDDAAVDDVAAPGATGLLDAVLANADALDVVDFTARYVDAVGGVDDAGGWRAAVDLSWRFAGFDAEPVREEVLVGFAPGADGGLGITSFGGGDRRSPLWLSGPLEVRRSGQTLVLATTAGEADLVAGRAEAAVPVVRTVLPAWSSGLVVEVPASERDLDRVLGADEGTYAGIAAVTASVDGSLAPGAPVHVFVNPEVYDGLDPVGGQVVLSHEATHAATDAPLTTGVPLWLLEGFADYVALRDVDLPLSTTAAQIAAQVRQSGAPQALPGAAEFGSTDSHLGAAYESAWLACRLLADTGGETALVRLYEEVAGGAPYAERLEALFGLTEAQLTRRWRERLEDLAASTTDGT